MPTEPLSNTDGKPAAIASERREHGRLRLLSIECDRGVVIDMSAGGIRLLSRRRMGGEQPLVLTGRDGRSVVVQTRVVWTRRLGFGRHLSGLEFLNLDDGIAREIMKTGMAA